MRRPRHGAGGGMAALERGLLRWSVAVTAISGTAYWVMKDLMPRRDPFSVLGHPWQPHALALHVLVAPVFLFALGLIARDHVLGGMRAAGRDAGGGPGLGGGRRVAGRSGLMTVLLALPMVATGYLLQVITAPGARRVLAIAHLATGLIFAAIFAAHLVKARRRRRAPTAGAEAAASS